MSAKKLDFLLDTIDTEIADLADVVETEGPILADVTSNGEVSAVGINEEKVSIGDLDLDTNLFDEPTEPPAKAKPAKVKPQAALDVLNDAEGEVEAMLAEQSVAGDMGNPAATSTSSKEKDQDAARALQELLATREVDVSTLLKQAAEPNETSDGVKKNAGEPPDIDDQLAGDLFDDLEMASESRQEDAGADEIPTIDDQLAGDLLDDLEMASESGQEDVSTAEPTVVEEDPADALFAELEAQGAMEGKEKSAGEASTQSASDEELGALMTKKLETLVSRLVEERLSVIAERIITEKLNKIIASMK
ncbi:MAG: hypothetical protein JSV47_09050 [Deltaproteobacteria bacterium]|nr:MAG: hypothetical protein JSV47_09050 [Deltaproteobacteria bacterium]